jgi:hypothetical protein
MPVPHAKIKQEVDMHYPDKAIVWAYQNIYEPMKDGDNWIVNYKDDNYEWAQKSFISRDGAFIFYHKKIQEYKDYYFKLLQQRSK